MKILQLLCFPIYGSGSGIYVRKLSETLVKRGHEITIVAPEKRQLDKIKIETVKIPFMAAFTGHPEHPDAKLYSQLTGAQLNDIQSAFSEKIINVVESYKPDVIHVHHASNLSWIANYVKAVYQIHYVVTSHNTDVMNAILDKRYIPLTQDALNRADTITAVSKNTRYRLLKILGRGYPSFTRKTKVLPCGVDTKNFLARGVVEDVNKKYNLSNKKVALYSGKITSIKGVDLFAKAAKSFPDAIFIIVGDGEEKKRIEEIVTKNKINNVIFTGYLDNKDRDLLAQLYRRANLSATPSTVSEGIPLSALESMSCGTPVVASDIGGVPTAVKNMKNGILVKPKSLSALIEGIRIIFADKKLEIKLGKQARKDAVSKFDWNIIAKMMEKYYHISYERGKKNRSTKKPSYVSEEEYKEDKKDVLDIAESKK